MTAIDNDIAYLIAQLARLKMADTNLLIVSDHGFAETSGNVYLEDCIDNTTHPYLLVDNHPMMNIWPMNDSNGLSFSFLPFLSLSLSPFTLIYP